MKKLTVILLVLMLLCGCTAGESARETEETTLPPETVTEPVESTGETQAAETVAGSPVETETIYVLTRMAALEEDGSERWRLEYSYDEQGRCCGQREILYNGEVSWYCTITYTETEDSLEIHTTQPGGDTDTAVETYDDQGNLICRQQGENRVEYTYDEAGNLLSEEEKSTQEPGVIRREYTYDDQGRMTVFCRYSGGTLATRTEYTYDENGNLSGSVSYDAEGALLSYSQYSWEGNTATQLICLADGTIAYTDTTVYDDAGRVIRTESRNENGATIREYTYEPIEIEIQP